MVMNDGFFHVFIYDEHDCTVVGGSSRKTSMNSQDFKCHPQHKFGGKVGIEYLDLFGSWFESLLLYWKTETSLSRYGACRGMSSAPQSRSIFT